MVCCIHFLQKPIFIEAQGHAFFLLTIGLLVCSSEEAVKVHNSCGNYTPQHGGGFYGGFVGENGGSNSQDCNGSSSCEAISCGFGGGGASGACDTSGSGGGGYSGGGVGTDCCSSNGGDGSYNTGDNQSNGGYNSGDGTGSVDKL